MERLGYIVYQAQSGAGSDQGPAAWAFDRNNKKHNVSLWSGTDYSLAIPTLIPPWPIILEAMSVQVYDGTTQPGYPISGFWFEFGILLDQSTYMPVKAGYSDDAGRLRWTGRLHSHLGPILVFGNNGVAGTDTVITRFQALYTEEVRP